MLFGRANNPWTFEGGSLDSMVMVGFEGAIRHSHDLSVGGLRALADNSAHIAVVGVRGLLAEVGICTRLC